MLLTNTVCGSIYSLNCLLGIPQTSIQLDAVQVEVFTTHQAFENLAQIEFESAEAFFEDGVEFHRAGQFDEAVEAYRNAIRIDPTFDDAYINLGLVYIQLNQFSDAIDMFQQVLELPERVEEPASNHTLAHYNLAIIFYRQGELDEALVEVQQALGITPGFSRAQQLLQQLQERQEDQPQ